MTRRPIAWGLVAGLLVALAALGIWLASTSNDAESGSARYGTALDKLETVAGWQAVGRAAALACAERAFDRLIGEGTMPAPRPSETERATVAKYRYVVGDGVPPSEVEFVRERLVEALALVRAAGGDVPRARWALFADREALLADFAEVQHLSPDQAREIFGDGAGRFVRDGFWLDVDHEGWTGPTRVGRARKLAGAFFWVLEGQLANPPGHAPRKPHEVFRTGPRWLVIAAGERFGEAFAHAIIDGRDRVRDLRPFFRYLSAIESGQHWHDAFETAFEVTPADFYRTFDAEGGC